LVEAPSVRKKDLFITPLPLLFEDKDEFDRDSKFLRSHRTAKAPSVRRAEFFMSRLGIADRMATVLCGRRSSVALIRLIGIVIPATQRDSRR
jgi:hypothetical protein